MELLKLIKLFCFALLQKNIQYIFFLDNEEDDDYDVECEDENSYMYRMPQPDPAIDTTRIDEIPAKEPRFNAMPLKSALKKKNSGGSTPQGTPTQENRPLGVRQQEHNSSFK